MMLKDRTNVRYGSLVAKEYIGKSKWLCQCDCGNELIVYGGHLENGHTKSCGCMPMHPRRDLTGKKFGRLTVVEWVNDGKWKCVCDCGNETIVSTCNLRNGNTKSCGCLQRERASGASFVQIPDGTRVGKLTVHERVANDRFGHVRYRCTCDCGGTAFVEAQRLRSHKTLSCGCIKSAGEAIINQWLTNHGVLFASNCSLDDIFFSSGRRPFFDFIIYRNDGSIAFIIEYNGIQHYKSGVGWNDEICHAETVRRDEERAKACEANGYNLISIPYWSIDGIDTILSSLCRAMGLCLDEKERERDTIERPEE